MSRIAFCFFLWFLAACSNSQPGLPDHVLPPAKMQAVMWDLLRADALVTIQPVKDSSLTDLQKHTAIYQQVFGLHGISKQDFTRSVQYYGTRPDLLQPILDSLNTKAAAPVKTAFSKAAP